jgi:CheY-like chemotaxis protein
MALARLAELKAAGADVPLVLADQQLPGMSGTQLLARVRAILSHGPARAFDHLGRAVDARARSWRRRRWGSWSFT